MYMYFVVPTYLPQGVTTWENGDKVYPTALITGIYWYMGEYRRIRCAINNGHCVTQAAPYYRPQTWLPLKRGFPSLLRRSWFSRQNMTFALQISF